jgi:hypothetical protein
MACISLNVQSASFFSNSLDVYACTNEEEARSCKKCALEKNVSLQVDVNTDKSIVIQTFFEGKKNIGGGALDNCKVVDKKNWQCGDDGSYNEFNTFSKSKQTMTNGIYYSVSILKTRGISKFNIAPTNSESYTCAK